MELDKTCGHNGSETVGKEGRCVESGKCLYIGEDDTACYGRMV